MNVQENLMFTLPCSLICTFGLFEAYIFNHLFVTQIKGLIPDGKSCSST